MFVGVVAATTFYPFIAVESGYQPHPLEGEWVTPLEELAEFAGRNCYKAWNRPNPKTRTNRGYLANILDHGHESVLEHASVSFYAEGVSRSLLAELSRHRHLSFSVVSQRYVRLTGKDITIHPGIEKYGDLQIHPEHEYGWSIRDEFDAAVDAAIDSYNAIADRLLAEDLPKKKALEIARVVLPNLMDSPMVVTGNLRAWRDVLKKRYSEHADEEIKLFAGKALSELRAYATNAFQDFPETPYE